jgi:hypothetical protein
MFFRQKDAGVQADFPESFTFNVSKPEYENQMVTIFRFSVHLIVLYFAFRLD